MHNGGSFFGLCAGAYYSSARVEWEVGTPLEVIGDRPLGFFPGVCKGCVYGGFKYDGEDGARAISIHAGITAADAVEYEGIYYNGGGEFVGADDMADKGVTPFARYVDGEGRDRVAVVHCTIGQGRAILSSVHLEFPLTHSPAISALSKRFPGITDDCRNTLENQRWKLLASALDLLGLRTSIPIMDALPTRLLPQFLVSAPSKPHLSTFILSRLQPFFAGSSPFVLKDTVDTFHFHYASSASNLLQESRSKSLETDDPNASDPVHVIVCEGGDAPVKEDTPHFDVRRYYTELSDARAQDPIFESLGSGSGEIWRIGDVLLYGECVSSTQSLLEK